MDRALCITDLNDEALRAFIGTRCNDSAGLAIGTTKSKVKTARAISYSIDGKLYYKAATDDLFVHTDTTVQAADTTRYYALCLDASGNASIVQGMSNMMPKLASNLCLIGAIKVVTVGVTFTPGTTLNDAAGVTVTYQDLAVVPSSGLPL